MIIQGHRGCRAHYPENTLEAFRFAASLGVDLVELDVVCTGDKKILVSHDAFMHHEICTQPNDEPITEDTERLFNIYKMSVREAQTFICGTLDHPRFPRQNKFATYKPLLSELVKDLRQRFGRKTPLFNIEVKSNPAEYGVYQPHPDEYVSILLHEIESLALNNQCIVQSFDPAILRELNNQGCSLRLVQLCEKEEFTIEKAMHHLGFVPDGLSPQYKLITEQVVKDCKEKGVELIAWTVNTESEMRELIALGVENIITDYPEIALGLAGRYAGSANIFSSNPTK